MQTFTGQEYLQIDIANHFGLDKETWTTRLVWFQEHKHELFDLSSQADSPILYERAVSAYMSLFEVGHNMYLDATASGLQIMAALSGCKETAKHVNLVNTGEREDVYTYVLTKMREKGCMHSRADVKQSLMTHYYNSKATPQELLGQDVDVFYEILNDHFRGAEIVMESINDCWGNTDEHSWIMPDGHVVLIPVTEIKDKRVQIDELDGAKITYRTEERVKSNFGVSLPANIIHSIDGYVVREMVRRCWDYGIELGTIHDSFSFHPNYGNVVRRFYNQILSEIADSNLLEDILSQITGESGNFCKLGNISKDILDADYALS